MQCRLEALNQMAYELDLAHTEAIRQEQYIRQRLGQVAGPRFLADGSDDQTYLIGHASDGMAPQGMPA